MFLSALFIWQFVYWVWLLTFEDCKGDLIANAIFLMTFLTIKVTQLFLRFWLNQVYMFSSQRNIFVSSPRWIFMSFPVGSVVSPVDFLFPSVENLLLGFTPTKFLKFDIFSGESTSLHWGTETGCIRVLRKMNNNLMSASKYLLSFSV